MTEHHRQLLVRAGLSDDEAARVVNGPAETPVNYDALDFYKTSTDADRAAEAMRVTLVDVEKASEAVAWALLAADYPAPARGVLEELLTRLLDDAADMVRARAEFREAAGVREAEEEDV